MKNQWSQFPFVLRRKILLTFLAGVASIAVSLVIFTVAADRILLVLGGFIFAASLVLGISLWNTAARGRYEVVEGICAGVSTPMLRRYRKIQLIDEQGAVRQALKLFRKDRRTDYESRVMRLSRQALLSTAEIIKCVEQDIFSLPSERVLMEKVYGDSETTCQNIASLMKNSRSSQAVTLAVANLYLRQQIIFERIST